MQNETRGVTAFIKRTHAHALDIFTQKNSTPDLKEQRQHQPCSAETDRIFLDEHSAKSWWANAQFILLIADEYCYIRLRDVWNPVRFFKQMSGKPPVRFGPDGFIQELVDDDDPARHYTAFVFIGFWFFTPLAILILWLWEVLGFLRYGFSWSQEDIRLGHIGIRHGRQVRRQGPLILPRLIAQDLMSNQQDSR